MAGIRQIKLCANPARPAPGRRMATAFPPRPARTANVLALHAAVLAVGGRFR